MKARLPKGMGGGPKDMNGMIRQAQKMQEDMAIKQEELNQREFHTSVGGGVIEITMTGDKQVKHISIKEEVVDPEEIETLEELLVAAFNEVSKDVAQTTEAEMESLTGGLSVTGML